MSGIRRFQPQFSRSLTLNRAAAEAAIRAYNSDRSVARDEEKAYRQLGHGFQKGKVFDQIRALNAAYKTRASISDLGVIASAIEEDWGNFARTIEEQAELPDSLPSQASTYHLLRYFLAQKTSRKPRSLATKALHFAAPATFIPVDTYAADKLGDELNAGRWFDTDGQGANAFSSWYTDYLRVIRDVGEANSDLVRLLLEVDRETGATPYFERVRGLPKLIDKVLWWLGKEERDGKTVRLFL